MKRRKGQRIIVIGEREFGWLYSGRVTRIYGDDGRLIVEAPTHEVAGQDAASVHRDQEDGCFTLRPAHVRAFIERTILR